MSRNKTLTFLVSLIAAVAVQNLQHTSASEINPLSIGENATTYYITQTWDNQDTNTNISISFSTLEEEVGRKNILIEIEAPFYNNPEGPDPEVNSTADPYVGLWEYEVVEAFFLGANEEYLEIEMSPTGHYLLYYLKGYRNPTNTTLRIPPPVVSIENDTSSPTGQTWIGSMLIPVEYFPCDANKFNAYAIHIKPEDGENKTYMSLFPATEGELDAPDFHKLELFGDVSFDEEPNQETRCNFNSASTTTLSILLGVISLIITTTGLKID